MAESIYDIECTTMDHDRVRLDRYRGQVLLIVNTASFCGFTPQYKGLEHLQRTYHDRGFSVLGFPSNDFAQEPFGDQRISEFCVRSYGVSFPLFSKTSVNGADAAPLFKLLKSKAPGWFGSETIKWNFTKFLVGPDGTVLKRYASRTTPQAIERDLAPLLR